MPGHEHYRRQTVLTEIGAKGQRALREAKVVVVGLGALGSVSSDLLVRAGVGRMHLVDRDVVEVVNLQRQTLYSEADVDKAKAEAGAGRRGQVNRAVHAD